MRASLTNGAYVHERWGDLPAARCVAICESGHVATIVAKALARSSSDTGQQHYVVTDTSDGWQFSWNRSRVEADDAAKATAS